jgi:hypothetical protein
LTCPNRVKIPQKKEWLPEWDAKREFLLRILTGYQKKGLSRLFFSGAP